MVNEFSGQSIGHRLLGHDGQVLGLGRWPVRPVRQVCLSHVHCVTICHHPLLLKAMYNDFPWLTERLF